MNGRARVLVAERIGESGLELLGQFLLKRVIFVHVRGTPQQWVLETAGDFVRIAALLSYLGIASNLSGLLLSVTRHLTGLWCLGLAAHLVSLWIIPT